MIIPNTLQFDILEVTRTGMAECPIKWQHRHVNGHQNTLDGTLDRCWATHNILIEQNQLMNRYNGTFIRNHGLYGSDIKTFALTYARNYSTTS